VGNLVLLPLLLHWIPIKVDKSNDAETTVPA